MLNYLQKVFLQMEYNHRRTDLTNAIKKPIATIKHTTINIKITPIC